MNPFGIKWPSVCSWFPAYRITYKKKALSQPIFVQLWSMNSWLLLFSDAELAWLADLIRIFNTLRPGKCAKILQTWFSAELSWIKILLDVFWLIFHWSLLRRLCVTNSMFYFVLCFKCASNFDENFFNQIPIEKLTCIAFNINMSQFEILSWRQYCRYWNFSVLLTHHLYIINIPFPAKPL